MQSHQCPNYSYTQRRLRLMLIPLILQDILVPESHRAGPYVSMDGKGNNHCFNPCHAEYFKYYTPPQSSSIPVASMLFQSECETVWIQISWLHQKPADLDLPCFKKRTDPGSAGQG